MTSDRFIQSLNDIVGDLSRPLTVEQRFQRLLQAFKQAFPCDAAALLRLEGRQLQPLAIDGLREGTLGRRFDLADHPRLATILHTRTPVRFPADSELPDPYDGLILAESRNDPHVHDCLGSSLYIDNQPWGVITLDALNPETFDHLNMQELSAFVQLTEATVKAAELILQLEHQVQQEHQISRAVIAESQQAIIGRSPAIEALRREIATVAASDLTVLVCGETGVGKELVARALHSQSPRREAPLIYVNCAALPENLVESELFGHVQGAFTGASQARSGKFELADGGTLFLDEIGEIPLAIQAKLLRALQSGEVQRIGSDQHIQVDVRIVAATNRNLREEVSQGRFRADLYHRISVYPIVVPPLRERGRDILLLCGYFLERNSRRMGLPPARLVPESEQLLLAYHWPGNIRELEHCISRALLKAHRDRRDGDKPLISIKPVHLDILPVATPGAIPPDAIETVIHRDHLAPAIPPSDLRQATEEFQRRWIQRALADCDNNQARAARQLGLDRSNFYRLLKKLGIK